MDRFIVVILTTLCISLTILLLKPCTSQDGLLIHGLPRKLKLSEKATVVKGQGSQEFRFHKGQTKDHSGNDLDHPEGTTWAEGEESNHGGTLRVFTMDYTKVHRRRPIHNKSLPPGP